MNSALIDLRPFRASKAFTRLWIGSTLAGMGGQLTLVTVMLHVFELTASTFAVSMVAVAGLVPMILAGLYGGMLADAFDRRIVGLVAAVFTFVSTLLLAVLAWTQLETDLVAVRTQHHQRRRQLRRTRHARARSFPGCSPASCWHRHRR